jgi:hypothetical protein
MTYADALTVYHAHLVAAGAAVSPAITTVVRGEPSALSTVPVIAYWWGGRRESVFGGNTLSSVQLDEAMVTTVYVPDGIRLPNRNQTVEDYLRDVIHQIHDRLWADAHLGENVIGLDLSETVAAWAVLSNITARTASFTCWLPFVDVHAIAN